MTDEITRDSNGTQLNDGDSVTLIKDLKVKGTSTTLKRGTLVKGIRLTGNPDEVDCSTKQVKGLVLRTEFLKKPNQASISTRPRGRLQQASM
ncbi:alkylphosphonate utilization protein [Ochrobactrum pseudogrignonense]|nr:alkylphosphonate utilization protein [Brucella pseudogrignonensis]